MISEIGTGVRVAEPVDRRWLGKADCVKVLRASLPGASRIGLLEHCGTGNLGDDATVTTVLQQIESRWPAASAVGLSLDPLDSERRLGIRCFPIRQSVFPFEQEWSSGPRPADRARSADKLKSTLKKVSPLFRFAKALRNVFVRTAQLVREIVFLGRSLLLACELDLIIICGGGQLLDWGGPWAFPYTLFKWTILAKCAGVKCIFLNNGAGPLDYSLSRWFVKRALSMADYVSLRDRVSAELLRKVGFRGKVTVVADNAWSIRLPDGLARKRFEPKAGLVIGIAPMAYGDSSRHWVDDNPGYRRLIDGLAEFSGRMLERGHRIVLFSSDIWFDSQAIADLDAAIHKNYPAMASSSVTRQSVVGVGDLLAALSRVDCYVTCRFHGVVFASLLNVPTIALAPHPKVTTLMEDMGLSDYCVDISNCDAGDLAARVDHLVANMDDVRARISGHVVQFQSLLTSQFDGLFAANAETAENEHALSVRSVR